VQRLYQKLSINDVPDVLNTFSQRRDEEHIRKSVYRNKASTKRKRIAVRNALCQGSARQDKRARQEGLDYGSGIAITLVAQINGMTNQVEETSASSTGEIPTGIL
jgi:hypothetical protein